MRGARTCATYSARYNQMMRQIAPAVRGRIIPPEPLFYPRPRAPCQNNSIYYGVNYNQEEEVSGVRPNRGNLNHAEDDVLKWAARPLGWTRVVVFLSSFCRKCVLCCMGDVVGGFSLVEKEGFIKFYVRILYLNGIVGILWEEIIVSLCWFLLP